MFEPNQKLENYLSLVLEKHDVRLHMCLLCKVEPNYCYSTLTNEWSQQGEDGEPGQTFSSELHWDSEHVLTSEALRGHRGGAHTQTCVSNVHAHIKLAGSCSPFSSFHVKLSADKSRVV